jgi:hypothetical protein
MMNWDEFLTDDYNFLMQQRAQEEDAYSLDSRTEMTEEEGESAKGSKSR